MKREGELTFLTASEPSTRGTSDIQKRVDENEAKQAARASYFSTQ
jgi:hypothetical protein